MLCDESMRLIREERLNAEWALYQSLKKIKELFRRIEDPYIKGRMADVESVYRRLIGILLVRVPPAYSIPLSLSSS